MTDNELKAMIASLAERQAKTDEQMARTDAQIAKTDAQLAKTDAQLAKTEAYLNKVAAKVDRLAEMYGGMGNNQGKVAEEFFFNSLKHKPELNGIHFDMIEHNLTRHRAGVEEEYDLVLVNGKHVFVIEVKYRLHPSDIDWFKSRKVKNFNRLYPEYAGYQHHFGMATFAADDGVGDQVIRAGLMLLRRKGDLIETLAA